MPCALITGITGQDGSYLADLLLEKGYEVHGVVRRKGSFKEPRLQHLCDDPAIYGRQLFFHYADMQDLSLLRPVLMEFQPDELYHLAGQSHVGLSFEAIESTCEMTAMGSLRLLEMVREMERPPKFFHASSSEIFGRALTSPQDEDTPCRPVTPYGCAKTFATQMVGIYRQTYHLHACNGILFNHESPRRGENFVTQKICKAAAAIKLGNQRELTLGSLNAKRDWGDARDYVRGMWMSLQHEKALDFVFATGELHTVQEIVELAFGAMGLDWREHVKQDPRFLRPDEPMQLIGNTERAQRLLNWHPTRSFADLIREMTRENLRLLSR